LPGQNSWLKIKKENTAKLDALNEYCELICKSFGKRNKDKERNGADKQRNQCHEPPSGNSLRQLENGQEEKQVVELISFVMPVIFCKNASYPLHGNTKKIGLTLFLLRTVPHPTPTASTTTCTLFLK
jgi:hypothetical protein